MNRQRLDEIGAILLGIIMTIIIVAAFFFAVKKSIYCLSTTGQFDCVVVAPQATPGASR